MKAKNTPADLLLCLRHIRRARAIVADIMDNNTRATVNGFPLSAIDTPHMQEAHKAMGAAMDSVCQGLLSGLTTDASTTNADWREVRP